jgi:hypothetical protein
MVLPLLIWTASGLLFLVKPGWSGAYEPLTAFQDRPLDPGALVAISSLTVAELARVELAATALGPVYRVTDTKGSRVLVDARTGALLSPLTREAAMAVAIDAASRSSAQDRYGAPTSADQDERVISVAFAGGAVVEVGRNDLSLQQRGPDTDRIDLLYRAHYLQWTGVEALDRTLAVLGIVGTWALAALGVYLLRRSARLAAPGSFVTPS